MGSFVAGGSALAAPITAKRRTEEEQSVLPIHDDVAYIKKT